MGALAEKKKNRPTAAGGNANKLSKKRPISEGRAPGDTTGLWRKGDTAAYFRAYRQRPEVKRYLSEYSQRAEVKEREKLRSLTDEEKAKRREIRARYRERNRDEINAKERERRKTLKGRKARSEYEKRVRECKQWIKLLDSSFLHEQVEATAALGSRIYKPAREPLEKKLEDIIQNFDQGGAMLAYVDWFVWALGRIGDPNSLPLIKKVLDLAERYNDPDLLKECLIASGRMRNDEGRRMIKRFLRRPYGHEKYPDENTKDWAERAFWMSFLPRNEEEAPTFKERPLQPLLRRILERL